MSGQTIALSLFLVIVTIGAIFLLSIFIVIKRSIARRKGRIGRIAYIPVGVAASKELVNGKINATIKVRAEPRVIALQGSGLYDDRAERNLGFQFRAKTVDHFVDLKTNILRYSLLEAPPVRNIQDFLLNARLHAMNPKPDVELVETYCDFYNRARYDPGAYTDADYFRFLEIHHHLLEMVSVREPILSTESPGKSFRGLCKKRKSPVHSRSIRREDKLAISDFVEMKDLNPLATISADNLSANGGGPDPIRATISRSGSAASDDSQTALICHDDPRPSRMHQ